MLKSTQFFGVVGFLALSLLGGLADKAQAETFSIDGKSLNTNSSFRRIDGQPRLSIWGTLANDPDQDFTRLPGNLGGVLLKQKSTGNCLNAHYLANGREINVWPCNPNDPDQNWNVNSLGGNIVQIKRTGTNFCIDTPTRNNAGVVHLWDCNPANPNQRWQSNAIAIINSVQRLDVKPLKKFPRNTHLRTNNGYKLSFQSDGNLVLYRPDNIPVWATGTVGIDSASLFVQDDGNTVLYDRFGKPMWATNTSGNLGAFLSVQADGNLVVYTRDGARPLFATNTVGGISTIFNAASIWQNQSGAPPANSGNSIMDSLYFLSNWGSWAEYTSRNPFPNKGKNCTWYAHGRLMQLGFSEYVLDSMLGNAGTWDNTAARGARVVSQPQVGAIVVWEAGVNGSGSVGHVAVVEQINSNGTIVISESNWAGTAYSVRTIAANNPSKFIIVPK